MSKNGKPRYYYKHSKKWQQKHRSSMNRLPYEILKNVFEKLCEGVTLVDITEIPADDFRKTFGIQNLALVSKKFKKVLEDAMFEQCTFKIQHYRLHPKHRYRNSLKTLQRIQNLQILWSPRLRPNITTHKLGVNTIITMANLKHVTIDLKALSVESVELGNGDVELFENVLQHFNRRTNILPKWLKLLVINAGKVQVSLKYYFTTRTLAASGSNVYDKRIQCVTLSCDDDSVGNNNIVAKNFEGLQEYLSQPRLPILAGSEGYEHFSRNAPRRFRKLQEMSESRLPAEAI